jgi:hypothetical protein
VKRDPFQVASCYCCCARPGLSSRAEPGRASPLGRLDSSSRTRGRPDANCRQHHPTALPAKGINCARLNSQIPSHANQSSVNAIKFCFVGGQSLLLFIWSCCRCCCCLSSRVRRPSTNTDLAEPSRRPPENALASKSHLGPLGASITVARIRLASRLPNGDGFVPASKPACERSNRAGPPP